ncbi:uncharacterized protein LOC127249936 [Andrographis paniculata]|uniref:uncharacterized protein LOC127249936 n=1 Tax=Andrographis paniculata TaxID=175694 RepID=UPI0021E87561|nr:uncharacterized protein LOC127249936 [Andrographis paniculata]
MQREIERREREHGGTINSPRSTGVVVQFFDFDWNGSRCMDRRSEGPRERERDYRKGNWTLQETMVLIEAKKMDDQRRMKRFGDSSERGKPAELRWKWVEDYCWSKGCLRSQNQCNDKWDNLMRDFKKVREYERRVAAETAAAGGDPSQLAQDKSYWRIDKTERKDNSLPSNLLPQIYEALVDVVDRKGHLGAGAGSSTANVPATLGLVDNPILLQGLGQQQRPIVQHSATLALPLPLPFPLPPPAHQLPSSQPLPTSDSETREQTDSPSKRRKRRGGGGGVSSSGGDRETTSGGGGGGEALGIGSAISRSASVIAEAIQSGEERQERRHRELLRVQERRLQIEESKAEIHRQGVNGLVDAINKLANSILAFAGNRTTHQSPPK